MVIEPNILKNYKMKKKKKRSNFVTCHHHEYNKRLVMLMKFLAFGLYSIVVFSFQLPCDVINSSIYAQTTKV